MCGPMARGMATTILLATLAVACPILAVPAQAGGGPSFGELFDLFAEDSVNPLPEAAAALVDAARQSQAPGGCPLGALFIHTPAGDPLFQAALAAARRHAVLQLLNDAGIDTGRFFVDSTVGGAVDATFLHRNLDRDPPTLRTSSVPPKGHRVRAGDQIRVTMAARDDASPAHWQTGIKTIQLVADSEDGRFVVSENYEACAGAQERRVEAFYIVPANLPPVVRLSALAEDHGGLMDADAAEFPTGDWYGRIEWSIHTKEDQSRRPNENRAEFKSDGYADIAATYDGQGNLTGTLLGSQRVETDWWGYPHGSGEVCIGSAPPTQVRARVIGSYTPSRKSLSLQLVDVEAQIVVPWSGGGPNLNCSSERPPIESGPSLSGLVRSLQPASDGTYWAEFESADPIHTFRYSMRLRPAAN
ncbi:hypothetical protein RHIZO_04850 [Rhizobiaceae bacterium]|nr:hypothetical protein RHIZO_04850 [Rhizobiaceae bacterium]